MKQIKIDIANNTSHIEKIDQAKFDTQPLKKAAEHVMEDMGRRRANISVALVDDQTIKGIKKEYFGTEAVTDVISFDLRDEDEKNGKDILDCEVVINAQQAIRMAENLGHDPQGELTLYLVHGLLHQLGYDDQTPQQAEEMHAKEDLLLAQLDLNAAYYTDRKDKRDH